MIKKMVKSRCQNVLVIVLVVACCFQVFLMVAQAENDRRVHMIDLTREIRSDDDNTDFYPTIYRLFEAERPDSRILVNSVEVQETRKATSALLPLGFNKVAGGIDSLQGRRSHAFMTPVEAVRYQWTHDDFQDITQHSVVILMDEDPDVELDDPEHDLLTSQAVDCLIYDKQISVLITNHRYIDGKASRKTYESSNSSLELRLLNSGVVVIVSAAPLSLDDADKMMATWPSFVNNPSKQKNRKQQVVDDFADDDFSSFFFSYFMVFQPDRNIPVGLASVTLLNYTSRRPLSLSHEWHPQDVHATAIPVWPGTAKPIVRVSLSYSRGRSLLFSERQKVVPEFNEQHPAFFSAPPSEERPVRPQVRMKFAEHFGTHVDLPFHLLPNASSLSEMPKNRLFSNCCYKIDLSKKIIPGRQTRFTEQGISIEDFEQVSPIPRNNKSNGCFALFFTGISHYWRNNTLYTNRMVFPGLSPELATLLLDVNSPKGYKLGGVGIDTLSIDPGKSEDLAAHVTAAANDALILENLNGIENMPSNGNPVPCLIVGFNFLSN